MEGHQPHPRINAALLPDYQGKVVTVMGIASSVCTLNIAQLKKVIFVNNG